MRRRALLQATAAAGGLLAGCLEGEEDPESAGDADGAGSPTGTDEGSPAGTGGGTSGEDGPSGDDGEVTDEATDDESTGTGTSDDEGEETPNEGDASGSNEMVERSFEAFGNECGQGANRADVSRVDDRVDVDGTIRGRNGCYTAELEGATYDDGADELTVAVRSYDDSDGGYCQQCIVDVDYRASFEFRDGTPDEVTVVHDGDHVRTE